MSKPRVLVLGGLGFVGRNFVQHLVENDLCSYIRVVDKALAISANLTAEQKKAIESTDCRQANLVNEAAIEKMYTFEVDAPFDVVVNLAGETKFSQTVEVYQERIFQLSVNCAKEAVKQGIKRFIEVSTAGVYHSDKKASTEDAKIDPWHTPAKYKHKAELELAKMEGLNVIFVRPAIIYGIGDVASGLMPRVVMGPVYKFLGESMKLLWGGDLKLNTVHVRDVSRALYHLFDHGEVGQYYNLCDKGDTDQEKISAIVAKIFGIEYGWQNKTVTAFAKLKLDSIVTEVNDKHLQPWSEICKQHTVVNSPLTPYLDKDLLRDRDLCVDGSKIESTGFTYEINAPTEDLIREVITEWEKLKAFPAGMTV